MFNRTEKIDFRQFMSGSPIESKTPSINKLFGLAPLYVPNGDIAFYGLIATAGIGLVLVGLSYLEHLSLKNGNPSVLTMMFDGVQKSLPIIFTGLLVYLIIICPIWRWI